MSRRPTMRMPFGKHRGKRLGDIPAEYLAWLRALKDLDPALLKAVKAELAFRGKQRPASQAPALTKLLPRRVLTPEEFRALANRWRREMAKKHHPDKGGTTEAMKAINEGYDYLLVLLKEFIQ